MSDSRVNHERELLKTMPHYTTFEDLMKKPDGIISPPKMMNLSKIIHAFKAEDEILIFQQICSRTFLQSTQALDAIRQVGMRKLFAGEGTGIRLSNYGKQVHRGELKLQPWGVKWSEAKTITKTNDSNLSPLTLDEYNKLDERAKKNVNLMTKTLRDCIEINITIPDNMEDNIKLAILRAILMQAQESVARRAIAFNLVTQPQEGRIKSA